MNNDQKKHIRANLQELVANTGCHPLLLSELMEAGVLVRADVIHLNSIKDDNQRVSDFYYMVQTRSDSYRKLISALRTSGQDVPADILDALNDSENSSSSSGFEEKSEGDSSSTSSEEKVEDSQPIDTEPASEEKPQRGPSSIDREPRSGEKVSVSNPNELDSSCFCFNFDWSFCCWNWDCDICCCCCCGDGDCDCEDCDCNCDCNCDL